MDNGYDSSPLIIGVSSRRVRAIPVPEWHGALGGLHSSRQEKALRTGDASKNSNIAIRALCNVLISYAMSVIPSS